MTTDDAIALFSSYSTEEKKEFLAQLMYELTIVGRDSYVPEDEGLTNPQRVRLINEVQHRLSAFLGKLLRNDSERYPDDVLVRIVLEESGDEVLSQNILAAFANAHRLTSGVSVS